MTDDPRAAPIEAVRFNGEDSQAVTVAVIREVPLTLVYNGREILTLLTTPGDFGELAVGFCRSEGFLERFEDLVTVTVDEAAGIARIEGRTEAGLVERLLEKRTVTSGCGKGTTFYHALDAMLTRVPDSPLRVPARQVAALAAEMNRRSLAGRAAGGVHHAALADAAAIVALREDIGRHNAIDKLQGFCFLERRDTGGLFLLSTGRISSEILIKAAKMGVPLVASLSSPSHLALELAARLGISVVGNLRGRTGTIYANFGHVT